MIFLLFAGDCHCLLLKSTNQHVFFEEETMAFHSEGKWIFTLVDDLHYIESHFTTVERGLTDIRRISYHVKLSFSFQRQRDKAFINAVDGQYRKSTDLLILLHSKHQSFLNETTVLGTGRRTKRALLPLGDAFKFLFGVSSENDMLALQAQVNRLRQSQESVLHATEESFTIMNLTRPEIAQNRDAINAPIQTAR